VDGPGGNADPLHQRQTSAFKATFVATILLGGRLKTGN
jgi:hypothetical protein